MPNVRISVDWMGFVAATSYEGRKRKGEKEKDADDEGSEE
jgi:hypothetical protein